MHQRIYEEFDRICSRRRLGGSILEVGAIPSASSLLCMKSLAGATEKIGVDLNGPGQYRDFKIVKGNANTLDCFEDSRFDAVVCNATLEHDKYFWRSLAAIRRVTRPGGHIVIGVPGYDIIKADAVGSVLRRIPFVKRLRTHRYLNCLFTATLTYRIHEAPGDYYRYSPQAVREVFFENCNHVEVRSIMWPPRIIGAGTKPV